MRRRFEDKDRELEDFIIRFYPAGNYTWIVPEGCFSVDVFLVGGGGSGSSTGGGGGYGGGGGGVRYSMVYAGAGGDGTVSIRGKKYKS